MFKKLRDLDLASLIQNLTDSKNRNRTAQKNQKRRPKFGYDALEPRKMLHAGTDLFMNPAAGVAAQAGFVGGHQVTFQNINFDNTADSTFNIASGNDATVVVMGSVTNSLSFTTGHLILPSGEVDIDIRLRNQNGNGGLNAGRDLNFRLFDGNDNQVNNTPGADTSDIRRIEFDLRLNIPAGVQDLTYEVSRAAGNSYVDVDGNATGQPFTTQILVNTIPSIPTTQFTVNEADNTGLISVNTALATDNDGDDLMFSLATGSPDGAVTINQNGTFTFRPTDENFFGTTTFQFTVDDTHTTVTREVVLTVNNVADDPAAFFEDDVPSIVGNFGLEPGVPVITNDNMPEFSGTADMNSTVSLQLTPDNSSLNTVTLSTVAEANGSWSIPVTTPIQDATYAITITTNAGSGPDSEAVLDDLTLTVDATKPSTPTNFRFAGDVANDST